MGGDKLLPTLAGISAESTLGKRIAERRGQRFRDDHLPTLRPFPEVRALLARIAADGFRIGVASSAKEDELKALLNVAGVADLIFRQTSSDDVEASKPDPEALHAAVAKLHVPPTAAVMIGDTPYDSRPRSGRASRRSPCAAGAGAMRIWPARARSTTTRVNFSPGTPQVFSAPRPSCD